MNKQYIARPSKEEHVARQDFVKRSKGTPRNVKRDMHLLKIIRIGLPSAHVVGGRGPTR